MKIIQTQGTRNSQGSYMVLFDENKEVYLSDIKGNNAFDTYQEALQVIKDSKPKLDDLLKSNLSLEEIDQIIAFESWGDLSK
jgi:hypothetical protein